MSNILKKLVELRKLIRKLKYTIQFDDWWIDDDNMDMDIHEWQKRVIESIDGIISDLTNKQDSLSNPAEGKDKP